MATAREPKTLLEAVRYFADPDVALTFFVGVRWPNGVVCPRCDSDNVGFLGTRRIWKCRACARQFSAKVGTVLEDSAIGLEKWMPALWMLVNCKNGISSYELGRALGVTQKTAWFMLSRLRLALQDKHTGGKLGGDVEIDETFIGGKARNMHKSKLRRLSISMKTPMIGKVAVMGLLERTTEKSKSKVRLAVIPNTRRKSLEPHIRAHVEPGASVHTDSLWSYAHLSSDDTYVHKVIDHAKSYAEGNVHTNGMENFWSLLKRTIKGTYVSNEPFHLFRYLDEQAFRFNNRGFDDFGRFMLGLKGIIGRRLTYSALTGNMEPETC
jgi:transposase-like protein